MVLPHIEGKVRNGVTTALVGKPPEEAWQCDAEPEALGAGYHRLVFGGRGRPLVAAPQGLGKVPECRVHRLVMPRRARVRWDGRALLTTKTLRSATWPCPGG
jgi:hypothetical protein